MTDNEDDFAQDEMNEPVHKSSGDRLRAARERKGLTLDQVASETRIARRHLQSIEETDFDSLPGRTYAVGFARTYAKTVGLDQNEIVSQVRDEMDVGPVSERYGALGRGHERDSFEPGDPSRAPGGKLLYFSIFAVIVLLAGIFFAARALFSPAAEMPSLVEQEEREQAAAIAARQERQEVLQQEAAAEPSGEVVFTAEGETWVRFYDADGTVLREGTLTEGDSFTIPADAQDPQLITGRPDRLAITIGGRSVRKLSTEVETVQDVPVSAEALLAREGGVATIGFGLGTPAPDAPETVSASTQDAAPSPAPRPAQTTASAPSPTPTPTAMTSARRTSAPVPSPTPFTSMSPRASATPSPGPAATAPPRAQPAEPADDGAAPEPQ
ncbi:helix-turn-helix domain-containing protein [Aurantiacibacter poecillastricola]|uniref:helix-turn-helix domain-containing protein n=1 Tax=Aurantiacibacter poecillastricola TaxID=3064385 RepID=UPI00273DB02F|nr:RodZ domain-containing protein [Aurantiacibacter sp. 219JJ12-13]MDP5261214.1 DUF4115 domain-containing protein [Aurantiacibacter sp. 219JJ12-13]